MSQLIDFAILGVTAAGSFGVALVAQKVALRAMLKAMNRSR